MGKMVFHIRSQDKLKMAINAGAKMYQWPPFMKEVWAVEKCTIGTPFTDERLMICEGVKDVRRGVIRTST